jgi:hypothetical protein
MLVLFNKLLGLAGHYSIMKGDKWSKEMLVPYATPVKMDDLFHFQFL